jgi:hypothetical protein
MNDTAGPEGLVQALLVFGTLPNLPYINSVPANQSGHIRAMHAAKAEYEIILAQRRIQTALIKRPPPAADYFFKTGSWVYAYREVSKMWTGPHLIADICGKAAYVHLGERIGPRQFNIAQLKPSHTHQNMSPDQSIGSTSTSYSTRFTEIVPGNDARASFFDDAKRNEILGLIAHETFRLAVAEEIPEKPNIIPSRYVLSIKPKKGRKL